MIAIYLKECRGLFSAITAYFIIGVFLLINSLFLWIFKGDFNIFSYGFAEMTGFFNLAPWLLLFLIPAITMKSISEEKQTGTLEIIQTKPIGTSNIVLGKFFAALTLGLAMLLPTIVYVYSINQLKTQDSFVDFGVITGSYLALALLIASFCAIGIFCSCISKNTIMAFISGVVLCFLFYYGLQAIADISNTGSSIAILEYIGFQKHYQSISKGAMNSKDVIFFISITMLFISFTITRIKNHIS